MINPILLFIFLALVIWVAGIYVTKTTDKIAREIGMGQAVAGIIILAIVTNLPEMAIMTSAAIHGEIEIGVGNLLGGVALQTVVICIYDFFRVDKSRSFSTESSSLQTILESFLVIFILSLVIIGHFLPSEINFFRFTPIETLIVIVWIWGVMIIEKEGRHRKKSAIPQKKLSFKNLKFDKTFFIFCAASIATLVSGYYLETVSSELARSIGMKGVVFGATFLAFVTALPEISTGLEAVWMKRNRMAISDIFGGNAFLPVLFFPASLIMGQSVIALSHREDIYLTGLAVALTVIYGSGLVIKSNKEFFGVGIDTILAIALYAFGLLGLSRL